MLVKLPNGVSVNPEIVKYIHIRKDRVQMDTGPRVMFVVSLKLEDGVELPVQYCDQFDIATEASVECTNRINKGLGVEEEPPPPRPRKKRKKNQPPKRTRRARMKRPAKTAAAQTTAPTKTKTPSPHSMTTAKKMKRKTPSQLSMTTAKKKKRKTPSPHSTTPMMTIPLRASERRLVPHTAP